MTKNLSVFALALAVCGLMAASQADATEMGSQGGANAQAQVGTDGAKAGAQVNTGGAAAGAQVGTQGTGTQMRTQSSSTKVETQVHTKAVTPMTGLLTVKDPALRTFTIQGQTQVYVAPEDVQIQTFEGEDVVVTFDENGRVTSIELDREG
jgi:hypothetical protein